VGGGGGRQRFEPGGRLSTKQDTSLAKESVKTTNKINVTLKNIKGIHYLQKFVDFIFNLHLNNYFHVILVFHKKF